MSMKRKNVNSFQNFQNSRFYASVSKKSEIPRKRPCNELAGCPDSLMISAGVSKFVKILMHFMSVKANQYIVLPFPCV